MTTVIITLVVKKITNKNSSNNSNNDDNSVYAIWLLMSLIRAGEYGHLSPMVHVIES